MQDFIIDLQECTACRACVLACHFHHTSGFGTIESSIDIYYDGENSDLEIKINSTCDNCFDEEYPLCVNACIPRAIRIKATGDDNSRESRDRLGFKNHNI